MKKNITETKNEISKIDEEKRDFLFVTTAGLAIAGGGATAISLITMNPAKDVLALSLLKSIYLQLRKVRALRLCGEVNQFY